MSDPYASAPTYLGVVLDSLQRTRTAFDATGFRSEEIVPYLRVHIDRETRIRSAFAVHQDSLILVQLTQLDGDAVAHELGHLLTLRRLNPLLRGGTKEALAEAIADVIAAFTYRDPGVAETVTPRRLDRFQGTSVLGGEAPDAAQLFFGNLLWELRDKLEASEGDASWTLVLQLMLLAQVLLPVHEEVSPESYFGQLGIAAELLQRSGSAGLAARVQGALQQVGAARGVTVTDQPRDDTKTIPLSRELPTWRVASDLSYFLNTRRGGHFVAESTLSLPNGMRLLTVKARGRQGVAIVDKDGLPLRAWYRTAK